MYLVINTKNDKNKGIFSANVNDFEYRIYSKIRNNLEKRKKTGHIKVSKSLTETTSVLEPHKLTKADNKKIACHTVVHRRSKIVLEFLKIRI